MRERNPPRNSQPETHRTDEAEGGPARAAPALRTHRAIDFPMPQKTHSTASGTCEAVSGPGLALSRSERSNAAGGR